MPSHNFSLGQYNYNFYSYTISIFVSGNIVRLSRHTLRYFNIIRITEKLTTLTHSPRMGMQASAKACEREQLNSSNCSKMKRRCIEMTKKKATTVKMDSIRVARGLHRKHKHPHSILLI